MKKHRIAVILFNLGGPDATDAIRPFLYNLFADKQIISLPAPFRQMLAKLISTTRYKKVTPLYKIMGGRSPILPNTLAQAEALGEALGNSHTPAKRSEEPGSPEHKNGEIPDNASRFREVEFRLFPCMRYWHPMTKEVVGKVKEYGADKVILLPMYPQFSTTTTESSIKEWEKEAKRQKLNAPTQAFGCYPTEPGFIAAVADLLEESLAKAKKAHPKLTPRVLFSAHGLPKKTVEGKGDPYPIHVAMTAQAVVNAMGERAPEDWLVSYQSRVGPMEWIKPYTEAEIRRAGADGVPLVIAPIAFTCEHLETLVELDHEYKHVAEETGVPGYYRVPAVGVHPRYIEGLVALIQRALENEKLMQCHADKPVCPNDESCKACICK